MSYERPHEPSSSTSTPNRGRPTVASREQESTSVARRFESAALLAELVANPLDGGYQAAAQRRKGESRRRWYDGPLVAVGCLSIGFLAVVAYVHTNRGAPRAQRVHNDLVSRVRDAESNSNDLAGRLAKLQKQVAREQDAALQQAGPLAEQLRSVEIAAGQLAVTGPGVTVTLAEPKQAKSTPVAGRAGSVSIGATNILSDRDVRSVVNELWHDGAEAIAVNDVRLTPASAIRFAGDAVLVDFQPITSPYRVRAIGDSDTLSTNFTQSAAASRYQTLQSVDHIGFSIGENGKLVLPAGTPASLRHATVPSATQPKKSRHRRPHK